MGDHLLLSLARDAVVDEKDGALSLRAPRGLLRLTSQSSGVLDAIGQLAAGSLSRDEVLDHAGSDTEALVELSYSLRRLETEGLVRYELVEGDHLLARLVPTGVPFTPPDDLPVPDPARLSRFSVLRAHGGRLVAESSAGRGRLELHDARVAAFCSSLAGDTFADAAAAPWAEPFLRLLNAIGGLESDGGPALGTWEPHDLLFHSRSRLGRVDGGYGGTLRHAAELPPWPAVKPPMSDRSTDLHVPDLEALARDDPPLARVVETRASRRELSDEPPTVEQLGELLYRTQRLRAVHATAYGEVASRPYPSGGALYELEVYPVVASCHGLAPGLYHYESDRHRLAELEAPQWAVDRLLTDAFRAAEERSRPQVLLVIAARFPRVTWKYESMAYALVLKHVGVLYQTVYLAGTAMGLAVCGLGGGDAEVFAAATGLDYYEEGSVGEILVGRPARTHEGG